MEVFATPTSNAAAASTASVIEGVTSRPETSSSTERYAVWPSLLMAVAPAGS